MMDVTKTFGELSAGEVPLNIILPSIYLSAEWLPGAARSI